MRRDSLHESWNDDNEDLPKSFVGMFQLYTDKTATTLKANATVAHPVHVVLLNVTREFRLKLINGGHTLVGLLPVATLENDSEEYDDQCNDAASQ